MADHLVVRQLGPEQIAQAFPLAEMLSHQLTEQQWSSYVRSVLDAAASDGRSGVITVQNKGGTVYGLSAFRIRPDLYHGRVMEIENFAAMDPSGGASATQALLEALEDLARRQRCNCISISLLNPAIRRMIRKRGDPSGDLFRTAGYVGEPMRLRKCF